MPGGRKRENPMNPTKAMTRDDMIRALAASLSGADSRAETRDIALAALRSDPGLLRRLRDLPAGLAPLASAEEDPIDERDDAEWQRIKPLTAPNAGALVLNGGNWGLKSAQEKLMPLNAFSANVQIGSFRFIKLVEAAFAAGTEGHDAETPYIAKMARTLPGNAATVNLSLAPERHFQRPAAVMLDIELDPASRLDLVNVELESVPAGFLVGSKTLVKGDTVCVDVTNAFNRTVRFHFFWMEDGLSGEDWCSLELTWDGR